MSVAWQLALIGVMFVVVFLLHRRARRANFERFRAYHSRRKYRLVVESRAEEGARPDSAGR